MKKNRQLIAMDTQALRKLDTEISEESPYKHVTGGEAYAPADDKQMRVVEMYDDYSGIDKRESRKKILEIGSVVLVAVFVIAIIYLLLSGG